MSSENDSFEKLITSSHLCTWFCRAYGAFIAILVVSLLVVRLYQTFHPDIHPVTVPTCTPAK